MSVKSTVEQLATVAAMLRANLSPDEAVKQALQLFEAADKLLRADEIADEKESDEFRREGARLASIGLDRHDEKISLTEAYKLQKEIAEGLGVKAFKTERRFAKAMRDRNLTTTLYGGTTDLIRSSEVPASESDELTSQKAIEELFRWKAEQRKAADRSRKRAKANHVKEKFSKNLSRNTKLKKRNKEHESRNG